jgi:hypothetical protein
MKNVLASIALVAIATLAGVTVVELTGAPLPASFGVETVLSLFVGAFVVLMFISDSSYDLDRRRPARASGRVQVPAPPAAAVRPVVRSRVARPARVFRPSVTL